MFEFLDINFAKLVKLNFKFLFSPAAYIGQIKTKSDFINALEKSNFTKLPWNIYEVRKTEIIFLLL